MVNNELKEEPLDLIEEAKKRYPVEAVKEQITERKRRLEKIS